MLSRASDTLESADTSAYAASVIVGVILAAGESTRMRLPKALLAAGGGGEAGPPVSFLARLVDTFRAAEVRRVVVVTGALHDRIARHAAHEGLSVELAHNTDPARGQLSSLQCALRLLAVDEPAGQPIAAIVATTVDAPLVRADTVARLIRTFVATGAAVVRPATTDDRHGHPVVFGRAAFDRLAATDPALGAKVVVRAFGDAVINVAVDDPGAFLDIDTPEDYRRAFGRDPLVVNVP